MNLSPFLCLPSVRIDKVDALERAGAWWPWATGNVPSMRWRYFVCARISLRLAMTVSTAMIRPHCSSRQQRTSPRRPLRTNSPFLHVMLSRCMAWFCESKGKRNVEAR